MVSRPALIAFAAAAVFLTSLVLPRSDVAAAGTIEGDVPSSGGLALVSWSGGPTTEIIDAAAQRGCAINAIWSFVGGFPVGYLAEAPDFVNGQYLAVYPNGEVPKGPLLLVCRPTLRLSPGDSIGSIIGSQPAGTTFVFSPGIYRRLEITPRNGDTFRGEPGAILRGSQVLTDFESEGGGVWSIGGQTSQIERHGSCGEFLGAKYEGCDRAEQLFIDDEILWQVTKREQLTAGRWYFDYGADQVYIADNPAGRNVELSVTEAAFVGSADDVTISGFVIERYASRAQRGAIHTERDASGWLIEDNEVRYNHGTGIRTHDDMVLRNNFVHHNGQIGIGGLGNRILVEGNEISFNGIGGFNPFWEAGGTKWVLTNDLVVRNNYVHDNLGRGLWTDIDNRNSLIEDNLVENNDQSGIAHEISYSAVIRNNIVRNNGQAFDVWVWGAQILVQNSADTTITGNTVTVAATGGDGIAVVNQKRGDGRFGTYISQNVRVQGNDITYLGGVGQSGVADDTSSRFSCGTSANVTFDGNTYRMGSDEIEHWFWCKSLDWSALQGRGSELLGFALSS